MPLVIGGDNLPSLVGIRLSDLSNIGEASGPPAPPPVPASLNCSSGLKHFFPDFERTLFMESPSRK